MQPHGEAVGAASTQTGGGCCAAACALGKLALSIAP
jgi:hypothetical protein